MSDSSSNRVKYPVALKLSLASVGVLVLVVAGFAVASVLATQKQYSEATARLRKSEIAALQALGLATARNIGDSTAAPLLDGDIGRVVDTVDSVAKGNKEITEILVTRADFRLVATSGKSPLGEPVNAAVQARLKDVKEPKDLGEITGTEGRKSIAFGAQIALAGRPLGYLYLSLSTERVERALAEIDADRQKAFRLAIIRTVGLGIAALLFGVLIAVFQGVRFGSAIKHLAKVAEEVGGGNLDARAQRVTNDEIGVLADRFNEMTGQISDLLRSSMEKAVLDKEVERARAIQNLLMPHRDIFQHAGFSYCGWCEPATEMGGDWWSHFLLGEDRLMLCVGDVTGHGIPSAMLTASCKAGCDTMMHNVTDVDMEKFLSDLDFVIREAGKGELVMTLFATMLDRKSMQAKYGNAGHNFPFVISQGNKLHTLVARGGRLGDAATFQPAQRGVLANDLLVMFTDGLIECENGDGEEYGMRRFSQLVRQLSDRPVNEVRDRIIEDAFKFYGNTPRKDDITLVICRA